jgi:hypothetical protein
MMCSDHTPILAKLQESHQTTIKPFGFENVWLAEDDFQIEAQNSWSKSYSRPFHLKARFLAQDLKKWIK